WMLLIWRGQRTSLPAARRPPMQQARRSSQCLRVFRFFAPATPRDASPSHDSPSTSRWERRSEALPGISLPFARRRFPLSFQMRQGACVARIGRPVTEHLPEPTYEPPRPPRRERRYLKPRWRLAGRSLWILALSLLGIVALATAAALVWLQPGGGPFEWRVDVRNLELRGGSVTVRPELGADATIALRDLNVTDAHALYAADSAAAALGLSAQLSAPGQAPLAVDLDATLEG